VKEIYPYRTLFGDVVARVKRVAVDDEPLTGDRLNDVRREVDLAELERAGWSRAAIYFELTGPTKELEELQKEKIAPTGWLIAQSGPTNSRQTVQLETDRSARWSGRLDLERSNWFGRISLRPILTATVDAVENRIIGEGKAWTVLLDDLPKPPVTGALTIKWEDFDSPSDETLNVLRSYAGDAFFLHLDTEAPVLYLNRSFEGLHGLLHDRRRRPPAEQALHDETRGAIATEIWLSLFNTALQAVETDDGQVDWPQSEWQQTVLELILDRMYPEKTSVDALHEAVSTLMEPEGASDVQQRLLPVITAHSGGTRLLREAIRRIGTDLHEVGGH
jgi:hypothetical protein